MTSFLLAAELLSAGIYTLIAIVVVLVLIFGAVMLAFCIRKVQAGEAGVRTGIGGLKVTDDWMLRIPFAHRWDIMDISIQKLVVARKGKEGLICKDNIRADIEVAFYVRVHPDPERIKEVAVAVGADRASDPELLRELFEAKFSDALKAAGKQMEFADLYVKRVEFRTMVEDFIGSDLNGYELNDVAIDYLEQAARDDHDPGNVLDAQGIKKINDITAGQTELTNERTRAMEVEVEQKNTEADIAKRELERQNKDDEFKKSRAIRESQAVEEAAAAQVEAENREKIQIADLEQQENVEIRSEDKTRAVQEKQYSVQKDKARLEEETVMAGQKAKITRERQIGLDEQEKNAVVIAKENEVEESKAGLAVKKKATEEQEQNVLDTEADMQADRVKRVMLVEANATAEAALVADVKKAEADRKADQERAEKEKFRAITVADAAKEKAERSAEEIRTLAAAEADASEKKNHAMQQEAEGTAAIKSADGLAEARVITAKAGAKKADAEADKAKGFASADVTQKQGEAAGKAKSAEGTGEATAISAKGKAEGEAISAKGTAEGTSIDAIKGAEAAGREKMGLADATAKTEMAKAIELFNQASKEHEEFRLQLSKDRDVDLAEIQIQKDVAEAQARVVGEALKSAHIDIVGGENDFFEKVVNSVKQGKTVDRLLNNSQALTDVKNTFFTGDPDHFKSQLRSWVQDLGMTSEDVKNLTISALLTKLIASSDDSTARALMRSAQKAVRESGLGDTLAGLLLDDKASK